MQRAADADPLDILSNLFASDALLASQFFGLRRSVSAEHRPFRKLMIAVLGDAIDCFLNESFYSAYPMSRRWRLRAEAERWLFDDAAAGPFSFHWICDGLDIDASYLRVGIRRVEAKMALSKGL